jgi:hypothetical protein
MAAEALFIQGQGRAGKERGSALAAFGILGQTLWRYPVDGIAAGTDDMKGLGHDDGLLGCGQLEAAVAPAGLNRYDYGLSTGFKANSNRPFSGDRRHGRLTQSGRRHGAKLP